MRTPRFLIARAAPLVVVLVVPIPVGAFELSGGVSMGVFQAGTLPRLAVTPHTGISWRRESGILFVVHDLFSILAPINKDGLGIYNKTSITIGYAWEELNVSAGPSVSIYSMQRAAPRYYVGALSG